MSIFFSRRCIGLLRLEDAQRARRESHYGPCYLVGLTCLILGPVLVGSLPVAVVWPGQRSELSSIRPFLWQRSTRMIPPGAPASRRSSAFASISGRVRRAFPRRVASILLNQSQYRVSEKYTGTANGNWGCARPDNWIHDYALLNAHRAKLSSIMHGGARRSCMHGSPRLINCSPSNRCSITLIIT